MKTLAILALIGAVWLALSDDGMAQCEKNHSRDTCFYSLHH